ncbi:MAG: hypothetical protein AAGE52_23545 [Myxococcota bacterium]
MDADPRDEVRALVKRAGEVLSAPNASYRGTPAPSLARTHIRSAVALLCAEPLPEGAFDAFDTLWTWVLRQDFAWDRVALRTAPTGDFDEQILSGRPDLTETERGKAWLAANSTDDWVTIAFDGAHQWVMIDTSAEVLVVVQLDDTTQELVVARWCGAEDFILGFLIESMLRTIDYRNPRPVPVSRAEEVGCALGCLGLVAAAAGLVWWAT